VYLDDHCQAQELNEDLLKCKKSSTVEAHTHQKLGLVFTMAKGRALGPSLL
jgi:hypothetical protein